MRLSHALVVVAASFLLTSEVLSASTNAYQATMPKYTSSGLSKRLLRVRHPIEVEDESEERGKGFFDFSREHQKQLKDFAKDLGFNLKAALKDPRVFNRIDEEAWEKYKVFSKTISDQYKS
ncbi:Avirulence (Avh) protein [Phytophthora megakarya]|uniref:RxLR effector protein n=1 Tax=Phytophthora megakarya TaxID=4795 RepID=A0A225VNN4_9STRA|nr:Avirulence (Avh) protein [Phytophthora megakarya]